MKTEIENLKKVNNERVKEIEKLTSENEALKNTQRFSKQEIRDEFKDFVNNEVKAWKEERENIKLASGKYLNYKKWKAK